MQKYKLNGQWVSGAVRKAATLKKQELGKVKKEESKKEPKKEVQTEVKTEDIRDLRAKYKELHPENKGVAVKFINDAEYIKQKITEFTK